MGRLLALIARGAGRLSGFAVSVVLLAVASLFLMPATIGAAGLHVWSSIVLAQALAQIAATVIGCGYGVIGPAVVATLPKIQAIGYFRLAQRTKFAIAVPCLGLMAVAMFVIPNADPIAGLLGGAPLALNAFSAIFFYIGRAAPIWLLWAETAPRVLFMFAGTVSLQIGAPLLLGLALPVLGTVLGIAVSYYSIRNSATAEDLTDGEPFTSSGVLKEIRSQLRPAAASILRGGRDALPVLVLTAVAGGLVGAFGVFDRIQRQALGALTPLTSALQGWVPRRMALEKSARPALAAMAAAFAGASVFMAIFTWIGSPLIRWLSAGTVNPTLGESFLCSAVIATSIMIQVLAYVCLVPLGGISGVIASNLAGIVAVVVALPAAALIERSIEYALGAIVLANGLQMAVQLYVIYRRISSKRYLQAYALN